MRLAACEIFSHVLSMEVIGNGIDGKALKGVFGVSLVKPQVAPVTLAIPNLGRKSTNAATSSQRSKERSRKSDCGVIHSVFHFAPMFQKGIGLDPLCDV